MRKTGQKKSGNIVVYGLLGGNNVKKWHIVLMQQFMGWFLEVPYNEYTVLFMGRPFEPDMFYKFIDKLESELKHPVMLYYWVDQQSGNYLNDRKGLEMHIRKKIFVKRGFFVARCPQRYSIWTYTPKL